MASQIASLTIVCLLNRLFRRRSKKTSKLRVTGLCVGNSPVTGEFPTERASNAENISIWWRHHEFRIPDVQHVKAGSVLILTGTLCHTESRSIHNEEHLAGVAGWDETLGRDPGNLGKTFIMMASYHRNTFRITSPDSKFHGATMGPIWGRQDPCGPMLAHELCYLGHKRPQMCTMSLLIQVMALRQLAPSHYLNNWWPRIMALYGITKHRWFRSKK